MCSQWGPSKTYVDSFAKRKMHVQVKTLHRAHIGTDHGSLFIESAAFSANRAFTPRCAGDAPRPRLRVAPRAAAPVT